MHLINYIYTCLEIWRPYNLIISYMRSYYWNIWSYQSSYIAEHWLVFRITNITIFSALLQTIKICSTNDTFMSNITPNFLRLSTLSNICHASLIYTVASSEHFFENTTYYLHFFILILTRFLMHQVCNLGKPFYISPLS